MRHASLLTLLLASLAVGASANVARGAFIELAAQSYTKAAGEVCDRGRRAANTTGVRKVHLRVRD
ncbi:MAG: hypothetical protein U0572_14415 [Phycisphaerales bacterium]